MKKTSFTFFTVLISLLIATGGIDNVFAQAGQSQQKTVHLFNGKDFDGWYKFIKDRGRDSLSLIHI